jgi:hypothetical protein
MGGRGETPEVRGQKPASTYCDLQIDWSMLSSVAMKNDATDVDNRMGDIDRTLLRENLKLTPSQRLEKFVNFMRFTSKLQRAGKETRIIRPREREG